LAAAFNAKVARPYFAEAIGLARALDDRWRLSQILVWQATAAIVGGDPSATCAAAEEGRDLADAIGDRLGSRACHTCLGWAQLYQGDLAGAAAQFGALFAEANRDGLLEANGLAGQGITLAWQGDTGAAWAAADAALQAGSEFGEIYRSTGHSTLGLTALAAGDAAKALDAYEAVWRHLSVPGPAAIQRAFSAQAALAGGDMIAARRWADDAVSTATGWYLMVALTTRARVAIALGEPEQAERDAHDALARAAEVEARLGISDTLECLGTLACDAGSHREAARLFGAAHGIRQRMGAVRFKVWDAGYEASVAALRNALGDQDFDSAWAEGAALSTEEAIAYAQRGRGERKRPSSGGRR
jgi:tetratricopeptide (TPR) repeat protein